MITKQLLVLIGLCFFANAVVYAEPCSKALQSRSVPQSMFTHLAGHRIVLDTSVILADPHILERFVDAQIIIPGTVIDELNDKKDHDRGALAFAAREFSQQILPLTLKGHLNESIDIGNGCSVRGVSAFDEKLIPNTFDPNRPDTKIAAVALEQHLNPTGLPVVMMSGDRLFLIRASMLGLNVEYFDYQIPATKKSVQPSVLEVIVNNRVFSAFQRGFQNGESMDFEDPRAHAHQFVILKTKTMPDDGRLLARFETGEKLDTKVSATHGKLQPLNTLRYDALKEILRAKNLEQRLALDLLLDPDIPLVFIEGKAGTGKTLLALAAALAQSPVIMSSRPIYDKVLLSRSAVLMGGENPGTLPGDLSEKMNPFLIPYFDNLERLSEGRSKTRSGGPKGAGVFNAKSLIASKQVEIETLAFTRGRSLAGTFWIVDEAQNLTRHQLMTIITRLAQGSKVVIMGDPAQIDPPLDKKTSGLQEVMEMFRRTVIAGHVTLIKSERSAVAEVAAQLLEDYNNAHP